MAFKSEAQRRHLFASNPELAKKFEDATDKDVELPEHFTKQEPKKRKRSTRPEVIGPASRRR